MKTVIDTLTSAANWTLQSGTATVTVRDHPHLAASYLTNQLYFNFTTAGIYRLAIATPVDVSGADYLAISTFARTKEKIDRRVDPPTGFRVKVRFVDTVGGVTAEYYLPLKTIFDRQTFERPALLTQVNRIELEATEAVEFMVSEATACTDELPIDIYRGFKDLIERYTDAEKFQIGTLTGSTGDTSVDISGLSYAEDHSVIQVGSALHMVDSETAQETGITFGQLYDGAALTANYTAEPVYLTFPVQISPSAQEASIPGIAIGNGFQTELDEESESDSVEVDSIVPGAETTLRTGYRSPQWKWEIQIEGTSRHGYTDQKLLKILRRACNRNGVMYVNGKQVTFQVERGPADVAQPDPSVPESQLQMICSVTLAEDSWQTESQPITITLNDQTVSVLQP